MLRINIYIPEELNKKLNFTAQSKHQVKAAVIRDAIEEGLKVIEPKSNSVQALLDLAEMAKKIPTKGKLPADLIENMDYYTWGGEKRVNDE